MFVKGLVRECDIDSTKYEKFVDGAWVLSRGETGRWCVVLHVGPEHIRQNNLGHELISLDEAVYKIESDGDWFDGSLL